MAQNRKIGFELLDLRGKVDKKKTKTHEDDETQLLSSEPSTLQNIQELISGTQPYFQFKLDLVTPIPELICKNRYFTFKIGIQS